MQNQEQNLKSQNPPHKGAFLDRSWLAILVFIVGTTLLGFFASLMGGRMTTYWTSFTKPPLSSMPLVLFVVRMMMYLVAGFAVFFAYGEKSRLKFNRSIDLILFYAMLSLVFFFPLFFFRLGLAIFATCILAAAIILAIITLVRFWANNLVAGILLTVDTIWLLYLFYVSLGVCLLA